MGQLLRRSATRSARVWKAQATGAAGEEELGAYLAKRCPGVIVLNDRRMPRSKANTNHLAIAPTGIFVIDAKRYKGKVEVRKPIFGDEKLVIARRNKAKLIEGLSKAKAVKSAIESIGDEVPVNACFASSIQAGRQAAVACPCYRDWNTKLEMDPAERATGAKGSYGPAPLSSFTHISRV